MVSIIQRVSQANVQINGRTVGQIGQGILALLGIARQDGPDQVKYLVDKIIRLRIFEDEQGKMNRSLLDIGGELLVVSQFTLLADCLKGRRPSFTEAAPPEIAVPLYEQFIAQARTYGVNVQTGVFGAMMSVNLTNAGPVTFVVSTNTIG